MQVRVEDPRYPEGEVFEIPGLGAVENYSTKDVDEVQVEMYRQAGYRWPSDDFLLVKRDEEGHFAEDASETLTAPQITSVEDVEDLKVVELREELRARDLPTTGTKDELIARLAEAEDLPPATNEGDD